MAKKRVGIRNGALFNQTSTLWNNLLAYYTGDGTPDDALGNYNGTLVNGATYGTGKINQGFSFDGVNDYVNLGNNLDFDGSTPFSISTWVYVNTSKQQAIISKESAGNNFTGYIAQIQSSNQVLFYFGSNYGGGDYLSCQTTNTLTTNTWQMVTITYDGSKSVAGINIFLNGVSSTLSIFRNTLVGSTSNSINTNIGAAVSSGAARYFNGLLDEVGIWDRELSESEVTELYNSGNGKQYTPPVVSTPSIITDGLVLNLDAGDTSSYPGTGTDWFDLTSNDNDGVLVNGPTYLTDNGGVISFDGVNDYVDFNNEFNVVNNVTVCAWVKSDNTTQTTIIGKYEYSTNNRSWYMGTYTNGSSLQVILSSNGSTFNRYLGGNISDGQWHHVSFSFSSGDVKLYIDSVEQSITQIGTNIINSLHSFSGGIEVGSVSGGVGNFFNGEISNTKVYSKVLTNNEIQQNYNSTKSRFGL